MKVTWIDMSFKISSGHLIQNALEWLRQVFEFHESHLDRHEVQNPFRPSDSKRFRTVGSKFLSLMKVTWIDMRFPISSGQLIMRSATFAPRDQNFLFDTPCGASHFEMRSIARNHLIMIVIMIFMRMDQSSSPS